MSMNVIRQVLVAIMLAAVATSAAQARHHGKATANASRHVRTIATDRDHRGSVPHPNGTAAGSGHAGTGTSGHHAINVDTIFVRPPGRDARHPVKPGTLKKATLARPAGPSNYRRQRPDPGATAKNA